ncbi:hypothetical protein NDU88_001270 [Pleurodeles waltl]|uniref:Uncharacterized protein n=1 Tax=Pleurodeles waltl TaxID=8319 RepID=A0AAV7MMZ0_PLEWA|nr:hypothetical protein NDU88_001270 [Pleurodeles waltl]
MGRLRFGTGGNPPVPGSGASTSDGQKLDAILAAVKRLGTSLNQTRASLENKIDKVTTDLTLLHADHRKLADRTHSLDLSSVNKEKHHYWEREEKTLLSYKDMGRLIGCFLEYKPFSAFESFMDEIDPSFTKALYIRFRLGNLPLALFIDKGRGFGIIDVHTPCKVFLQEP